MFWPALLSEVIEKTTVIKRLTHCDADLTVVDYIILSLIYAEVIGFAIENISAFLVGTCIHAAKLKKMVEQHLSRLYS